MTQFEIFAGIDWSTKVHQVAIVGAAGPPIERACQGVVVKALFDSEQGIGTRLHFIDRDHP